MKKIKKALISVSNKKNLRPILKILEKKKSKSLVLVEPLEKFKSLNLNVSKYRNSQDLLKF